MERIATRIGEIAVEVQGEGPPIVLLHSVAHDHHDWDAIVPVLSRTHRTLAVDWPGHGASDMFDPPASASAEQLFDALDDLVEALKLPPAIFVGNSIGGTASLRLAIREPQRVRGLVMIDSAGLTASTPFTRAACWIQGQPMVRRATGMAFARHYLHARNERVDALLERLRVARTRPGFIEMDAAMWRSFASPGMDLSAEASALRCPTLLVWGKHDPVLPPSGPGQRAREVLGHAEYVELDTGHTPFVEDPQAFLAVLSPFLERLDPGKSCATAGEAIGSARPASPCAIAGEAPAAVRDFPGEHSGSRRSAREDSELPRSSTPALISARGGVAANGRGAPG